MEKNQKFYQRNMENGEVLIVSVLEFQEDSTIVKGFIAKQNGEPIGVQFFRKCFNKESDYDLLRHAKFGEFIPLERLPKYRMSVKQFFDKFEEDYSDNMGVFGKKKLIEFGINDFPTDLAGTILDPRQMTEEGADYIIEYEDLKGWYLNVFELRN